MSFTSADLKRHIQLILSQTERCATIYALRDPSFDIDERVGQFGAYKLPIADPGDAQIINEQVLLLRTLYAQCSPELQEQFPAILMDHLSENTAAVIVHTTIANGHISTLGNALREKPLSLTTRLAVWYRVREKLATESHRFTEHDLTELDAMRVAENNRIPRFVRPEPPISF